MGLLERIANNRVAKGKYKDIKRGGKVIWRRYYLIRTRFGSIFLHQWFNSDSDFHDHPWNWGSIVLSGYCTEWFLGNSADDELPKTGFSFCWRNRRIFHMVEIPLGMEGKVWTLFFHGPRKRKWGFFDGKWVYHANFPDGTSGDNGQ